VKGRVKVSTLGEKGREGKAVGGTRRGEKNSRLKKKIVRGGRLEAEIVSSQQKELVLRLLWLDSSSGQRFTDLPDVEFWR